MGAACCTGRSDDEQEKPSLRHIAQHTAPDDLASGRAAAIATATAMEPMRCGRADLVDESDKSEVDSGDWPKAKALCEAPLVPSLNGRGPFEPPMNPAKADADLTFATVTPGTSAGGDASSSQSVASSTRSSPRQDEPAAAPAAVKASEVRNAIQNILAARQKAEGHAAEGRRPRGEVRKAARRKEQKPSAA